MKQNKLKFMMSLVMLLFALSASAFMVDGIAYYINGNEATVTYTVYGGQDNYNHLTVANIPENVTYNNVTYPVTAIGNNAFENCRTLTSVTIPNSVTSIGYSAFNGTAWYNNQPDGLVYAGLVAYKYKGTMPEGTSIVLKEGTKGIAVGAFLDCTGLASVTIPNSVTSIGYYPFARCSNLTSVVVEDGNEVYDSRNNCNAIIETAINELIAGCPTTVIPNSVTSIGYMAFLQCSGLTSIDIPNSVTSISNQAFYYCKDLTSVTIGNSVTSIGDGTFDGCSSLTSVNIPNSVTSIGIQTFNGCAGLTNVTIGNSVTTIEFAAFRYCSNLKSVTIPNSVTSIGDVAFYLCTSLTSVTIPNSVTSIGYSAFRDCSNLTSVTIGNSVTHIGEEAFYECTKLKWLQFNAKKCTIGENAFTYGRNHYPISVTRLLLGEGMECLPSGLPRFSMSGKTLVLPICMQKIDSCALVGTCAAIVIGDSIDSIGSSAFSSGISVAYVSRTTPSPCPPDAFVNPQTLYVPAGCKGKYLMSDGWCEFANIVEGSYTRVTDLALDVDSATMHKTETLQLNASVLPSDHSATALDWWSNNTAVATVSTSGLVTAVAEGEVDICCYVDNKTVVCHITVVENHIADSIQLNYTDLLLDWDNIVDLTATVLPESVDQTVTWTIPENDNIYARVVGNKLRVMAMRSGLVTVTATSVADPSVRADCVITIQIPDVNGDTSLNIADVTALIDYLLGGDPESINIGDADVNRDGNINIADVTTLIDKLLSGN